MKYQFKLVEVEGPSSLEKKWQYWARFVLNCSISQEIIRIPVQVSVYGTVVDHLSKQGESDKEIMQRLYAFSRKSFEQHFRERIKDGFDALKEDIKDGKLVMFEIKNHEDVSDKLGFSKGDEFVIEI